MSRFAKIDENAIKRQSELSGEELRLFILIKFHTWNDSGVCNKNLKELAQLYGLVYNHTTERYKSLRKKGWCKNSKNGIVVLDLKTPISGVAETPKIGVEKDAKLQKSELETPKIGVEKDAKLQKSEFPLKEYIEPLKDEQFRATTHDEKTAGVSVENNGNLSKFSLSDCLSYVEICRSKGDDIRNPRALAITLHNNGSADAFISAALYPEQTAIEQTIEYDAAAPETRLHEALDVLIDLSAEGHDLSGQKQFYAPDDWAWLMEQLEVYK